LGRPGFGDSTAIPPHRFANIRAVRHLVTAMPPRTSVRAKVFSIEGSMDELVQACETDWA
jgi:hypothetical protein